MGIIKAMFTYLFKNIISYVVKRCTGGFLDFVFDEVLTAIAKSTENTIDDRLVESGKLHIKTVKKENSKWLEHYNLEIKPFLLVL